MSLKTNKPTLLLLFTLFALGLLFSLKGQTRPIHAQPSANLIPNGDFSSGTAGWWTVGLTNFTFNGEFCGEITNPGSNYWDVLIGSTTQPAILNGHTYRLSYAARATANTSMNAIVSLGRAPWSIYFWGQPALTSEMQTFTREFSMNFNDDPAAAFAFQLGNRGVSTICIDDIVLEDITPPVTITPTATPVPTITPTPVANPCDVEVALWYEWRDSALSFSFDDGYRSQHTYLRPLLNQYGVKATFYPIHTAVSQGWSAYGSWAQFAEMAADGHEIGGHGTASLTTLPAGDINTPGTIHYELNRAKMEIESNIPISVTTYAYPNAAHHPLAEQLSLNYYSAARGVMGGSNPPTSPNRAALDSYLQLFNTPRDLMSADDPELAESIAWIDTQLLQTGKWGIFTFHEVVPFAQITTTTSWHPATTEWLTALLDTLTPKVQNKEVWIATISDVNQYSQERGQLVCDIVSQNRTTEIILSFMDNLDNALYNQPLSVAIAVPNDWQTVTVAQNSGTETVQTMMHNGKNVVMTEIIPDDGLVTLQVVPTAVQLSNTQTESNLNWQWVVAFSLFALTLLLYLWQLPSRSAQ